MKHQNTKAEVKANGKCYQGEVRHVGDREIETQYWVCDGIVYCSTLRDGYEVSWWCMGKASKVERGYGLRFPQGQ